MVDGRGSLLALLLVLLTPVGVLAAGVLNGRVVVPDGVDPASVSVFLHAGGPSEIENHGLDAVATVAVDGEGLFALEAAFDPAMQLEFVGPSVRRARFPVAMDHVDQPGKRAVFRLEPGGSATLLLSREGGSELLGGAVVGPIFPAADAPAEMMEAAYPFLVQGDANGIVVIEGLVPGVGYDAPVFAPGHERQVLRIEAGVDQRIALTPGGASIRGTVMGSRTSQPYTDIVVQARHGVTGGLIQRRTEVDGTFRFDGLEEATYVLRPVKPEFGDLPGAEFRVARHEVLEGAILPMPEGIRVEGTVADAESGMPLVGALVRLGEATTTSNAAGQFLFEAMMGPWPRTLEAELDGYESPVIDGQQDDARLVETNGLDDVGERVVRLQRRRFLELTVDVTDGVTSSPDLSVMTELIGKPDGDAPAIERVRAPMGVSIHEWRAALPRVVVGRTAAGLSAEPVLVDRYDEETTARASLLLVPAAGLRGRVVYDDGTVPPLRLRLMVPLGDAHVEMMMASGDEAGAFALAGLPPGRLRIEAQRSDTRQVVLAEDIVLVSGQTAEFERIVARGKRFAGRVVNAEGKGVASFALRVYGQATDGSALATTMTANDDGEFALEDLGGTALREITWEHEQFKPSTLRDIALPQDDYLIVLESRSGIKVTVQAAGDMADGEILTLAGTPRTDALYKGQWFFDTVGRQLLGGEPEHLIQPRTAGELRVAARVGALWDVTPAFKWSGGDEERSFTLAPASNGELRVEVAGLTPEALASADVLLLNTTLPTGSTRPAEPRVEGSAILFERLDPGAHLLVVTTTAGQTRRVENIEVANGKQARARLAFVEGDDRIVGRVVLAGATESPLAGVDVVLSEFIDGEPAELDSVASGSDGSFTFERPETTGLLILSARWEGQTAAANPSPEGDTRLVFHPTVRVDLRAPAGLRQRLAASPSMVLMFSPEDGLEGLVLKAEDIDQRQSMRPGRYAVSLGDVVVGDIVVREGASPQTVDLPEPAP